jgi:hypothetical protein
MAFQGVPVPVGNTVGDGSGTITTLLTDSSGRQIVKPPTDGTNTQPLASAANLAAADQKGAALVVKPGEWRVSHNPAAATQATIQKAGGGAGVKHVVTGIAAYIACGATAQTPLTVRVIEETSNEILFVGKIAAPANGQGKIELTGLNIIQVTANKGLTVEFTAAGVTASEQSVWMTGYSVS